MITTLVKQYSGLAAAGFAAAVCAGKAAALAAMGALGVGMFATQTVMFPVFVGLVALSLWLLYRSARGHGHQAPFYLALAAGMRRPRRRAAERVGRGPQYGDRARVRNYLGSWQEWGNRPECPVAVPEPAEDCCYDGDCPWETLSSNARA